MPSLQVLLDSHPDATIVTPFDQIHGWGPLPRPCEHIEARCMGVPLPFSGVRRPDVAALGPNPFFGFSMLLDLPTLSRDMAITPGQVEIEFCSEGETVAHCPLQIAPQAIANNAAILENQRAKQAFIARHARRSLKHVEGCRAPSALPDNWKLSPAIGDKTDPVSSNEYGTVIIDFLNDVGSENYVLDAGAGLRKSPHHNVVNMDIYDYPSTDILAIGQDLPFHDDTFDAALSIAVLEHVDDPFGCAKELIRVVKPGGRILTIVPFLQPEHGYPSHYFNATRFGLRKLFSEGTTLEKHFLEMSNHPIFTLNQILGLYACGLPEPQRTRFLNTSIGELLGNTPTALYLDRHEFVTDVAEETQWTLAFGTTAIFVKD